MHPDLLSIDFFGLLREPLIFRSYGLMVALGFILGSTLAREQAAREKEDPERVFDLCLAIMVAGLIGAKVVYILTRLSYFSSNPWEIVTFWRSGLVWYGGFLGACCYLIWFTRHHRLNMLQYLDLLIPYTALGHALGRIGCLLGGCCFGRPTDLPWGITFPVGSMVYQEQVQDHLIRLGQTPHAVHPTQLYEFALELSLFAVLICLRRYKKFHGQLFLFWVLIYPVGRSIIEMFRGDTDRGVYVLSTSQYISVGIMLTTACCYFYLRSKHAFEPVSKTSSKKQQAIKK